MRALCLASAMALFAGSAEARVTRIDIVGSEPAFGGAAFGEVGAYVRLVGRVHGELDPADPANSGIQDINLAPRNARGMVEYTTNIELLRPADLTRGNRVLMFEVNNRGNKLALANFNEGVAAETVAGRNGLTSPGDGWLMRSGYTLVWFGWEMDVLDGMGRVGMPPVVARNHDGSPITGIVRSEMITPRPATSIPISLSQQIQNYPVGSYDSYPTASLDNRTAFADGFLPSLTVRAREQDPRTVIPNSEWSFRLCDAGKPASPDEKRICYPAGFEPGRLYELIYRAKDPTVGGLGFAALRDLGAFLRNSPQDESGTSNPVYRKDNVAILEGSSQSGRMIRSFLALGFNADENGGRVFDGAYPHIGGGLMPLNVRFGQPVRAWGEQTDHLYPAYDFPFSYARQSDPLTGRDQGLLDRCSATETCPRIFHVATALEMWEGRQSLGLTDPLGRRDVDDPPNVRTFIMASTQHGSASLPLPTKAPFGNCQQQPNPNPQLWTMRALLSALTAWVRDGAAPPASARPRIDDGTLVPADQVRFPEIPANAYGGAERPATSPLRLYDPLHVLDFGPLYRPGDSSGVIVREPPLVGSASYGVLEPQVDSDGNDLAGIRSVFAQVPIGTYTGWNLGRKDRFEGGLCNLQGSFIPFAATRAERLAAGDPRLSIEERYPSKDAYLAAFRKAADDLVAKRYLLPDDAKLLLERAQDEGIRTAP
jgi:Alpha/beta hydrolase domain